MNISQPNDENYLEEVSAIETLVLRLALCEGGMSSVLPDLYDPEYSELRADLLLAAESLHEKSTEILIKVRKIAWQDTKVPRGGFEEPRY
jgi:hypothetical protein